MRWITKVNLIKDHFGQVSRRQRYRLNSQPNMPRRLFSGSGADGELPGHRTITVAA